MFTFGRERERESALKYLKDSKDAPLILAVIDSVHDLLEKRISEDRLREVLIETFVKGGSGVWEQTGAWIRKFSKENPSFNSLWLTLSDHPEWQTRFRVATFINEMPADIATTLCVKLKDDQSKKVSEMALARMEESKK